MGAEPQTQDSLARGDPHAVSAEPQTQDSLARGSPHAVSAEPQTQDGLVRGAPGEVSAEGGLAEGMSFLPGSILAALTCACALHGAGSLPVRAETQRQGHASQGHSFS